MHNDLLTLAAVMETWADHLSLILIGNTKVWETTTPFQLYTTDDIFSLGWIVLMWDGNNFAFGRIKLHLQWYKAWIQAWAKRLLVDDKITACVKGICKVLNRKALSGLSLVKHFAFLKISKFCASSNLLFFFLRAADWPTTNFLEMLLFSYNPIGQLCLSGQHCKGKIHPLELFWNLSAKVGTFSKNSRRNSCYCTAGSIQA